jgi:cell division septation protein DedD
MEALMGTQTALVLGDPTNIVESVKLKVRMLDVDLHSSDLEDSDEDVAVGEKELFIGADVERLLTPMIVLQRRHTAADLSVLSPFERFVLDQIDGKRTMHDIQFAMGLSEGDLRIAVALLADKHLVQRAPVATAAVPASTHASSTASPPRPSPPPSPPPPPPRAVPAAPPPTPKPTPATAPTPPELKTVAARPVGTSIAGVLAALLTRAARDEEANNLTSAIEALVEAVHIDPGSAIGHNRLGVLYARTRQLPLAVEHLTRARDLRPADPTILSNYNKIVSIAEHTKKRR